MMPGKGSQITLLQYILTIHSVQIGAGLIPLPGELAKGCGTDGWIALILGYIVSIAAGLIIVQVMKLHPQGTITDLVAHYFGRWAAKGLMIVFICYFIAFMYFIYHRMALLVQNWIMQQTSPYLLMLLFLPPAYVIANGGFRIFSRYAEITFILSLFIPLALLFLLKNAHWIHLLPIVQNGWMPIFRTLRSTLVTFFGFEMAFFLYPYLENQKAASLGIVLANTITLCVYLFFTLLSFVIFSPDELVTYHNTLISLFKMVEFRFVERYDILILSVYVLLIMRTWLPMMIAVALCTKQLGIKGSSGLHIGILLAGMVIVTWLNNPSWNFSTRLNNWLLYAGSAVAFGLPLLLWALLSGRRLFARRLT
ncbi:GerAB/ArcD/ProY family transporter [Paenibacillus whitsoniae]|uniref:Spore gernimation protein n=1 Tax=Paenibacillus whitsoniae TaxID=2496558 RepID=A0A3S0A451_9BACL|nr:endospore germination permease [Paenibacillus whitsoniae]RTE09171.1 spore gernimation protein [Paenibacillus whitsoniae]